MKLYDKCVRNYFETRENHKCIVNICKDHEWWCQLHIGKILECDCYDHINFATHILRSDGRIEWECEHGIGHTLRVPEKYENEWAWWSHGCDGCCEGILNELGINGVKR